jgi:hypothetical protein
MTQVAPCGTFNIVVLDDVLTSAVNPAKLLHDVGALMGSGSLLIIARWDVVCAPSLLGTLLV